MATNQTQWFRHSADTMSDIKFFRLRLKFGWWGMGVYWGIKEFLRKQEGCIFTYSDESLKLLSEMIGVSELDKFKELFLFLFDQEILILKRDKKTFFDVDLHNNLREFFNKSKGGKKGAEKRWGNRSVREPENEQVTSSVIKDIDGIGVGSQCEPNAIRKDKIRKDKIDIVEPPSPPAPGNLFLGKGENQNPENSIPGTSDKNDFKGGARKPEKKFIPPDVGFVARFSRFVAWVNENAPNVQRMKQPLDEFAFEKIEREMPDMQLVQDKLMAMSNKATLTKEYVSAYLTLLAWYKRGSDRAPATALSGSLETSSRPGRREDA